MSRERGRSVPMSLPRTWIADMAHFSRSVPVVGAERTLRLRGADQARTASGRAVGWAAMMTKAMGLASKNIPDLRRAYMPYPWGHFYEAPYSVASIVVGREFEGEAATLMAPLLHPERLPIQELDAKLERLKTAPFADVGAYRRLIRNARYPRPMRRLLWSVGMFGSGLLRARTFGTFAINSIAGFRGRMLTMITPITSCLYYGTVTRDGEMLIQLAFDHRVFDGYAAGRVGGELERVLNGEIAAEVAALGNSADRHAA